jgi:hypothetical protein
MPANSTVAVSISGRTPVLVPAGQVAHALRYTTHVPKLHDRLDHALVEGDPVALSESEALLLLAEIRHGLSREEIHLVPVLVDALIGGAEADVQAHIRSALGL